MRTKKEEQINLRLTTDEKKALRLKAETRGYNNLSEFILITVIKPEKINTKRIQALCKELNRIGNNLNQIARRANQDKTQISVDILQQLAMIDEQMNEALKVAKS